MDSFKELFDSITPKVTKEQLQDETLEILTKAVNTVIKNTTPNFGDSDITVDLEDTDNHLLYVDDDMVLSISKNTVTTKNGSFDVTDDEAKYIRGILLQVYNACEEEEGDPSEGKEVSEEDSSESSKEEVLKGMIGQILDDMHKHIQGQYHSIKEGSIQSDYELVKTLTQLYRNRDKYIFQNLKTVKHVLDKHTKEPVLVIKKIKDGPFVVSMGNPVEQGFTKVVTQQAESALQVFIVSTFPEKVTTLDDLIQAFVR